MTKRQLSPEQLSVVQAIRASLVGVSDTVPARLLSVRVACSGGADSLALAAGLVWLDEHQPDPLRRSSALIVDHGLQDGSAEVAAGVAGLVAKLGLTASIAQVTVADSADGLEAAARQARYQALVSGDVDILLVGHTMDDQAETVLLGLARGSGTRSLAGMDQQIKIGDVWLLRPLLGLRRSGTEQACADWGLTPWVDPMNADPRFTRVRARALLPRLDQTLGPGIVEALARTAKLARADADYLDQLAADQLGPSTGDLAVSRLADLPDAIRGRLVRQWLAVGGLTELSYERTQAVLALVDDWRGQVGVDLPAGRRVVRLDGSLRLADS